MLTDTSRWSNARGNAVVPSRWQATPDTPQKFMPAGLTVAQAGHSAASGAAHTPRKFIPAGPSAPH